MATQNKVNSLSLRASGDLSASQFCFVAIDSNGRIALPSAGGDCVGVLQDKPDALDRVGEVALLECSGKLKIRVASAGITAGQKIQSDGAGEALAAATGDHVLGTALTTGVDNDIIEFIPGSRMLLP